LAERREGHRAIDPSNSIGASSRDAARHSRSIGPLFSSKQPLARAPMRGFGRTVELDLEKVIPNPIFLFARGSSRRGTPPTKMSEWMIKLARKRKIRTAVRFAR